MNPSDPALMKLQNVADAISHFIRFIWLIYRQREALLNPFIWLIYRQREALLNPLRSCVYRYSRFTLVDIAVMSIITNTGRLHYKGRSLASKCIRVSHHKELTKACIEENTIPKGIGLTFYPSACADTSFEFTHFAGDKVHHTSEELLYYLDNHYTYAIQHTQTNLWILRCISQENCE